MILGYCDIELETQQLVLGSHLKNVEIVEKLIHDIQVQFIISTDLADDIWLVLNEAVSNSIKHGNKFAPNKKVTLTIELKNERFLCFTVSDQGDGFDPNLVPDPTSPERILEPNGRGVFLINKLCDFVNYSQNGTCLEMSFDLFKN